MNTEKLTQITKAIESGYTIYISNHYHQWKITKRTWDRLAAAGYAALVARGTGLYMVSGKKYVCIDGCRIVAAK
jgi:hypothetical protein